MLFQPFFLGTGAEALGLSVGPVSGFSAASGTSGSVDSSFGPTLTIEGGTSPYTYAWTHVSQQQGNTPSVDDATIASPTWTATVVTEVDSISTWKLVITDSLGQTAEGTTVVTLTYYDVDTP